LSDKAKFKKSLENNEHFLPVAVDKKFLENNIEYQAAYNRIK